MIPVAREYADKSDILAISSIGSPSPHKITSSPIEHSDKSVRSTFIKSIDTKPIRGKFLLFSSTGVPDLSDLEYPSP